MAPSFSQIIFVLSLLSQVAISESTAKFFRGRRHGTGMVPPPLSTVQLTVSPVKVFTLTQRLDHFDDSVLENWQQRYQVNDAYYENGGPIFVMISGEGEINEKWLLQGQMFENGKLHRALMFQLEHRFYGKSHPTKDASVESLRYLNSLQALADLDHFISFIKNHYEIPNAKAIVFGGSYAGNLAAWYRELYPNSTVGSISSSGPVLAEEDFIEYMMTVGTSMDYFDPGCNSAVNGAFQAIEKLVQDENDAEINALFGLCAGQLNYSDPYEIEAFYDNLRGEWMYATQYNGVGDSSLLANYCRIMTNESGGALIDRFSFWYKSANDGCLDVDYKAFVNDLKKESWDAEQVIAGARQWSWQTCTEFGYYQTTDSKSQPFGFHTVDLKYIEDTTCLLPFGITEEDIARSIAISNMKYGAKSPNARNVFLCNGSIDPWHNLGIYEHDLNEQSPSRYIEGTSHCYDMHPSQPDDPPQLVQVRQEIAQTITLWLNDSPEPWPTTAVKTSPAPSTGAVSAINPVLVVYAFFNILLQL